MHIVINGHSCDFFRRLEKTTDIDIKSKVGKAGGNNFRTTVMTILAHLCDKDTRVAAFVLGKLLHISKCLFVFLLSLFVSLVH